MMYTDIVSVKIKFEKDNFGTLFQKWLLDYHEMKNG